MSDIEDTEDAGAWRTSVLVLPVSSVVTHTILRNVFFLAVEVCGQDLEVGEAWELDLEVREPRELDLEVGLDPG